MPANISPIILKIAGVCVAFESVYDYINICPTNTLQLQHHTQWLEDSCFNIWNDKTVFDIP